MLDRMKKSIIVCVFIFTVGVGVSFSEEVATKPTPSKTITVPDDVIEKKMPYYTSNLKKYRSEAEKKIDEINKELTAQTEKKQKKQTDLK